jgi:SAM-dependent methyltransferase
MDVEVFYDGSTAMIRFPDGGVMRLSDAQRQINPDMDFDDITGLPLPSTPTAYDPAADLAVPQRSLGSRVGNEDLAAGRALALDPDASMYSLLDPEGRYADTPLGYFNQALMRAPDLALGGLLAMFGGAQKAAGYGSDLLGLGLQPGDIPNAEEASQVADALYALPTARMAGAISNAASRSAANTGRQFTADESGALPALGANFGNLPPPSNAQRTQISGTLPTYQKAAALLGTSGRGIDYGAGLGLGARELGFDSFEPFPRSGFTPTYTDPATIPSLSYDMLTNFNVLNVVPREVRDDLVSNIGRVIAPGGKGLITTRGRDVMSAQGTPGPEPMSLITSRDTYQKGFTQPELQDYLRYILGSDFEISPLRLGPAGAQIRRTR